MVNSLCRPEAEAAVRLLRSNFAGFLDVVPVRLNDCSLADFLTAEGVLLKPDVVGPDYCMASPLIDGSIRTRVIPVKFSNARTIPPIQSDVALRVLDTLIESIKFFDKDLIRLAFDRAYKTSNVPVGGRSPRAVPRASVYDTELMRVLSSWLSRLYNWTVTGQGISNRTREIHSLSRSIIFIAEDTRDTWISFHRTKNGSSTSHAKTNYQPIRQSDAELEKGVNVVQFAHDVGFTQVLVWARWRDHTGSTVSSNYTLDI